MMAGRCENLVDEEDADAAGISSGGCCDVVVLLLLLLPDALARGCDSIDTLCWSKFCGRFFDLNSPRSPSHANSLAAEFSDVDVVCSESSENRGSSGRSLLGS